MGNIKLNNQNGRSMIEMLGVLAIIGVLSVGGIAGYSKAMMKYRINKTIEQITLIAGNIRTFFAPQRSYAGLNNTVIKKAKLVPDEMWDGNTIRGAWGFDVDVGTASKSSYEDKKAFYLLWRFPLDDEICIEMLTQDWANAGVKGMWLDYAGAVTVPVNIDTAVTKCSAHLAGMGDVNFGGIFFYFDVNDSCWSDTDGNMSPI